MLALLFSFPVAAACANCSLAEISSIPGNDRSAKAGGWAAASLYFDLMPSARAVNTCASRPRATLLSMVFSQS